MEPIKRIPIIEQVEQQIRELIKSGSCLPGEKLPTEKELCQRLNVGRGTVREAFRLLQAKGYVELKPGRGAFVALPSDEMGAIEWLVLNEPMAARRMAERRDATAIEALERLHAEFLSAVKSDNNKRIAELDERFHTAITLGSGNQLLISILQQVNQEIKTFRSKTFSVPQNVRNAVDPHSRILQTIQAGDADGAEAAMRAHLDKVQEDLLENITAEKVK